MNILAFDYMSLLVYVPTLLFVLIVGISLLTGLRRGFRKSLILFINMCIAFGVAYLIFYLVFDSNFNTKAVQYANTVLGWFNQDLQKILGTTESYPTLQGYLTEVLATNLPPDFYIQQGSLYTVVGALVAMAESAVRLVMLVLLIVIYWIVKLILYLFYLLFFKDGRRKRKMENNYQKRTSVVYKKRRLLGMCVGGFRGLLIGVLLFSFIGSLFFIISGGRYSDEKQEDVIIDTGSAKYDITEFYDVVNRYGTVGIGKILESIKFGDNVPVYLLISDSLLKGNYVNDDNSQVDSGIDPSSFYGREELAPIIGIVKDVSLEAFRYGVDVNRLSDTDYLLEFFNTTYTNSNGVTMTFIDRVDEIISSYNFGAYMLYLGQCFVKALADSAVNTGEASTFTSKLMYTLFAGENRIKPNEMVSNDNIHSILDTMVVFAKNAKTLNTINYSQSQTPLAFGVRPLDTTDGTLTDEQNQAIKDVLTSVNTTINSFSFMKDNKSSALLSDITILLVNEFMPTYSLEGITEKNTPYSLYNIKWTDSLSNVVDIVINLVDFITKNKITNDNLIPTLLSSLNDTNSEASKILFSILDNNVVGTFLNAKGFRDLVNENLVEMNTQIPSGLVYGTYYDNSGNKHDGEVSILIKALSSDALTLYNIFTDTETSDSDKLRTLFSEETGLTTALSKVLDDTNDSYSKLLHSTLSELLINIDNFGLPVEIYVPKSVRLEDSQINKTLVVSEELKTMINILGDLAPVIFTDQIDYATLLTEENINKCMASQILSSTVSIAAYKQISSIQDYQSLIPSSLALDTQEHRESNMTKWVGDDTIHGELNYIVEALTKDGLLDEFFNNSSMTTNDLVNLVLKMSDDSINNASSSNVLNIIMTYEIQKVSFGGFSILVPIEAKKPAIEEKELIKNEEFISIMNSVRLILGAKTDITKIQLDRLFDDDVITSINNSDIMTVTVINILIEQITKNNNDSLNKYLALPTAYNVSKETLENDYYNTRWYLKEELNKVLSSIRLLGVSFDANNKFVFDEAILFKIALLDEDGTNSKLDKVLASEILYSSISKMIINVEYLEVIPQVETNLFVGEEIEAQMVIKKAEIKALFNDFVLIAGKENIEQGKVDFDYLSNQLNLSALKDIITSSNLDTLLKSVIVETKLTTLIYANATNVVCMTNNLVYNATSDENFFNWLSIDQTGNEKTVLGETKKVINSLNLLGLIDAITNNETIKYDAFLEKTDEELKQILESDLMYATILEYLLIKTEGKLSIPHLYNANVDEIKANLHDLAIVKDEEVIKIIHAVKELGISLDNISIDVNNVLSLHKMSQYGKTKAEVLAESGIVWLTLSKYVLEMNTLGLPPDGDILDGEYPIKQGVEKYLKSSEVVSFATSLEILGITGELTNFDVNRILDPNITLSKLCKSYIIWFNISDKLKAQVSIDVPTKVLVNGSEEATQEGSYIKKDELDNLKIALTTLTSSNIGDFDFNKILAVGGDKNIWNSTIIRYTVTNTILESNTPLIITNADVEEGSEHIITIAAISNFMDAIKSLGLSEINSIRVDFATVMTNMDTLLQSSIMQTTISHELFNANQKISVTETVLLTNIFDSSKVYRINVSHITDFMNAAKAIGLDSYDSNSFALTADKNQLIQIKNSLILRLTLNDKIAAAIGFYNIGKEDKITINTIPTELVSYKINQYVVVTEDIIDDATLDSFINVLK